MLNQILLAIVFVLVALAAYIATRPDEFQVTRSATFNTTPDALFAQVNDLHKWNAWSPWAKMDPNSKTMFEGSSAGVGAKMTWESDSSQVGVGSMTITESQPDSTIKMLLEFKKPFTGTNVTTFTFAPNGNQTTVTWSMVGKSNFVSKAMGIFFNCDKMVGGMFEKGFVNLKSVVEPKA